LDLKAALQQALNNKVKLKRGDKERLVPMATAGIEQLVAQYVKGDRHARRDLLALADRLGVNLITDHQRAIEDVVAANHAAILAAFVQRQNKKAVASAPVFAPPELLDDDPADPKEN
jgi:excinuclease UvrABC nuclease subunit